MVPQSRNVWRINPQKQESQRKIIKIPGTEQGRAGQEQSRWGDDGMEKKSSLRIHTEVMTNTKQQSGNQ